MEECSGKRTYHGKVNLWKLLNHEYPIRGRDFYTPDRRTVHAGQHPRQPPAPGPAVAGAEHIHVVPYGPVVVPAEQAE
eukprot:2874859-Pyramimonas_sp.AAC.4